MRDPNRIKPTLEAVEKLWRKYPDLRLGQLLWAIAQGDLYNMEDEQTIEWSEKELNGQTRIKK